MNSTNNEPSILQTAQRKWLVGLAIASAVVLAVGATITPDRVWANLLLATFYLLSIGLGAAVFLALTYVTGAGWHVAFRRVPESMTKLIPYAGVAALAVLAVRMQQYGWQHHGHGGPGTFWFKELWLTPSFWMLRAVGYVVIWTLLSAWLVARSRKQDTTGDARITEGSVRLSALFLAVYAVTFSLACADWIMALEPLWFSTMWGVYNFAGMTQATLAVIVIVGLLLRRRGGPLEGKFTDEHLHDLGKLTAGFACFWMYIWFSQYMLIWYSNIPEETTYFMARTRGAWAPIVVASILLNWIVPFFVLLPRPAKRSGSMMMRIAIVVLIGRWVDLYVMIFPPTTGDVPVFGIWEVAGILMLFGAGTVLLIRAFPSSHPVPKQDPYLSESLHYHAS